MIKKSVCKTILKLLSLPLKQTKTKNIKLCSVVVCFSTKLWAKMEMAFKSSESDGSILPGKWQRFKQAASAPLLLAISS